MSDIRSIKNTTSAAPDEYVEQLRQKIGTDFTDRKSTGKKKNEMGKDDFIKLMSAQLKYQDPINPMKNEQMAAQLAQFSALEQMVNVNQNLEKMSAAQKPQENMMAASLIGKRILTDSAKFSLIKGQTPDLKFEMPANAAHASISVVDNKGEIVKEFELGSLKKGPQSIKWDGKTNKGQDVNPGEFSFRVNAVDATNKAIQIDTSTTGLVSGVVFEQGKAFLLVEGRKVSMDVVNQIVADSSTTKSHTRNTNLPESSGLKNQENISSNDKILTEDKQDKFVDDQNNDSEKNTINEENFLQSAIQKEKIGNNSAAKKEVADAEENLNGAYPLWNPLSN